MDGLLIDTEDLYTVCTNEILRKYGKPDLPWNIKAQLQGRPQPEVGYSMQGPQTEHAKELLSANPSPGGADIS